VEVQEYSENKKNTFLFLPTVDGCAFPESGVDSLTASVTSGEVDSLADSLVALVTVSLVVPTTRSFATYTA
jgi:hypothetical protein